MVLAGSTVAQIVGAIGAGMGLVIAGAIGSIRAAAKKLGYRALVNF